LKIIRKSDLKFDSVGKVEAEREYTKRNATASGGNQERKSLHHPSYFFYMHRMT
jgi:hypothetical protein